MRKNQSFLYPLLFLMLVVISLVFLFMMWYTETSIIVLFAVSAALIEFISSILWYYKTKVGKND
jgi:phosphotransferase system  glucose/maltose/N-acetylglucosamine-specific IIC component